MTKKGMPGFQNSGTGTVGHVRARLGTNQCPRASPRALVRARAGHGHARFSKFGHGHSRAHENWLRAGTGTGFARARPITIS